MYLSRAEPYISIIMLFSRPKLFKVVSKSKDVTVSVFCFDRPMTQLGKYDAFTLEDIK